MNIKDLKKVVSIIILFVMIISTFTVIADGEPPKMIVSSQQIYPDGEATITITVDKALVISALSFKLDYDKDAFLLPNVEISPILAGLEIPPVTIQNGIIYAIGAKRLNVTLSEPFTVATVKFKPTNDAKIKKYDLTLTEVTLGYFIGDEKKATEIPSTKVNGFIDIVNPQVSHSGGSRPSPTPTPTPTPSVTPTPTVAPTPTPPAVVNVEVKPVVVDGKATSTVTEAAATKAITEAIATAKKDNTTSEVNINVEKSTEVVTTVETSIKESTMTALKSKSVDNVTVSTQLVDVSFDKKAITVISDNTKNDVSLYVKKVDNTTLSAEIQKEVGAKPVYDFSLVSNGKKISDFKDGSAKISIPYTLKDGEKAKDLVIYYIKDDGTLQKMTNVKYDEKLKAAVFYTNHFSKFAIAFELQFTDVSGWSEEFIYYLAKKGIINGKEDGIFAPEDNITRAEFVAIIARSVGVSKDQPARAEYSDVTEADWFAPYVTWAKEKGIVSGYEDGSFAPDKQITREELCTMIVRTLTAYNMAPEKADLSFADADITSDWAKESIASLAKIGVVSGIGDNNFAPLDNATRAESAKIISGMYKILNNIK